MSEPGANEIQKQELSTVTSKRFLSNLQEKTRELLHNPQTTSASSGIISVLSQMEIPNPNVQTVLTAGLTTLELIKNKTALAKMGSNVLESLHDPNKVALALGAADTVVNYDLPNSAQVVAAGLLAEISMLHETGLSFRSIIPHRNKEKVNR